MLDEWGLSPPRTEARPTAVLCYTRYVMAYICEVCGKKPLSGHRISHAHNLTKRRWYPNLQRVRAVVNGAHKTIRACVSCIRSGKVQKAS